MKKNKVFLPVILLTLFSLCFSGCKSSGNVNVPEVDAFDVLDQDCLMYLRLPVQAHKEFAKSFVASNVPEASETIVNGIVNNLDVLYLGYASNDDRKRIEVSASSSISSSNLNLLSKNAGWEKSTCKVNDTGVYTVFTDQYVTLAQPAKDIIALTNRNADSMLSNYDAELKAAFSSEVISEEWKKSEIYSFVTDDSTENIRFYMVRPLSLLTNLLGTALSTTIFQLNYVTGEVQRLPNTKYAVTLELDFKQQNLVTRAVGFVTLALGLTNSQIVMETPTLMKITNIEVSLKQLQAMLGVNLKKN